MTDANQSDAVVVPEGWIKHDGGPCPVDPMTRPGVRFRDGSSNPPGLIRARLWQWLDGDWWKHETRNDHAGCDIIAYKPEPGAGGEKG